MKRKKYRCSNSGCGYYTCYVIARTENLEPFICLKTGLWAEFIQVNRIEDLPLYRCGTFCKNFNCLFATNKKEKKTSCVFAYGSAIKIKEIE